MPLVPSLDISIRIRMLLVRTGKFSQMPYGGIFDEFFPTRVQFLRLTTNYDPNGYAFSNRNECHALL